MSQAEAASAAKRTNPCQNGGFVLWIPPDLRKGCKLFMTSPCKA